MSADQPVERAATLEDIRAEVLAPDRLNAFVFGGFARGGAGDRGGRSGGRAGVFGERADARVRHPAGDRIAAAAAGDRSGQPGRRIAAPGVAAGAGGGYVLASLASSYFQ